MVRQLRVNKWKPKPLWKPRKLAELSAELEKQRQKVRISETETGKTLPARLARQQGAA